MGSAGCESCRGTRRSCEIGGMQRPTKLDGSPASTEVPLMAAWTDEVPSATDEARFDA